MYSEVKGPDNIIWKRALFFERDLDWPTTEATFTFRPVLLALHCHMFNNIGHHGNNMDIFLPHQTPKVNDSARKGAFM